MSTPAFMKMSSESQSELQLQLQHRLESPSNSSTSTLASDLSASSSTANSNSDSDSSSIATMYDIPEDAPLPPTSNNLNREERLRLLRSTRKLEALLGTTPMVIDTELSESDYVAPLVSPRTKSRRREGRIFPGRAASPASTLDSADEDQDEDEEEYFVVPQGVQAADYQHVVGPGEQAPYSFSSTAGTAAARRGPLASVDTMTFAQASNLSVNTTASRKRKARGPLPAALVFDNSGGAPAKSRSAAAAPSRFGGGAKHSTSSNLNPSNRAQPQPSLFLRLRPAFGRSIKNPPQAAKSPYYSPPTSKDTTPLSPPIIQPRPPLSPSMATFANSNLSQASLASSHYSTASKGYFDVDTKSSYNQKYDDLDLMDTSPDGRRALTERERRKKMAKLARTLGENVPPELVFRPPPPTRRTSGAYASAAFGYGVQSYPKPPPPPPVVPGMPKLAVADVPTPPPVPVSAPVSVPTSSRAPAPAPVAAQAPVVSPSTSSSSRKSRPRSLTISPSSSTDTTRGTTSMDAPASPAMVPPTSNAHRQTKSLGRAKSVKAALAVEQAKPFTGYAQDGSEGMSISRSASTKRVAALSGEGGTDGFGRRKEREWSGEWNLKDMNDVAARLRGLKA